MAHITPDDGCNHDFSVRYRALLERYQHIIRLNLLGHTHLDYIKVAMSYGRPIAPVGVLGICGSVTTWTGNPSFCVYELDKETLLPILRKTFAFDMHKANLMGEVEWLEYTDYLTNYTLSNLSPIQVLTFAERQLHDPVLTTEYNTRMRRKIDGVDRCDDGSCMLARYCDTTSLDPIEHSDCNKQAHFDFKGNFFGSLFESLQGPWVDNQE